MISALIAALITIDRVQEMGQDSDGNYKVYPVRARQGVNRPYIIVRRSANQPVDYKTAPSTDDKPNFNVVVYSTTYGEAEEISNAVRGLLDGYKTSPFKSTWYVTAEDLYDPDDGGEGSIVINNLYRAFVTQTVT